MPTCTVAYNICNYSNKTFSSIDLTIPSTFSRTSSLFSETVQYICGNSGIPGQVASGVALLLTSLQTNASLVQLSSLRSWPITSFLTVPSASLLTSLLTIVSPGVAFLIFSRLQRPRCSFPNFSPEYSAPGVAFLIFSRLQRPGCSFPNFPPDYRVPGAAFLIFLLATVYQVQLS